ncbi:MAG TPA: YggS family pyridoxal phosphate-dependent enzyme [Bacillota bacterium]
MDLAKNLQAVQERINRAASRAGRDPKDIKLLAVTKTVGVDQIEELLRLGQMDLAENRVQDALKKQEALREKLPHQSYHMHLIGSLQRNKVRMVVGRFDLIHSVDRWSLAQEINKRGQELGLQVPVLLQVNVSGEETKHGLAPAELRSFYAKVTELSNLIVCGLMTMAPYVPDPEVTRPIFRGLRELFHEIKREYQPGAEWRHLSMGMSNDYEVAVEEGATLVRIGSAIFHTPKEG